MFLFLFFSVLIKSYFGELGLVQKRISRNNPKREWKSQSEFKWKTKTYINYVILGIVSICATDIQAVAIVHRLNDPYVIPAVEELFEEERENKN